MPRPRFLKLAPEKRETILEAAKVEFAQHGFDSASYNRIIAAAGLSKGAMYYYFDDKLDLYATVLEVVNDEMMALMGLDAQQLGATGWAPEGGDFWAAMRDMSIKAWTFTIEHPELAALCKGITALPLTDRKEGRLKALYQQWRTFLVAMLRMGQQAGQVRTDLPLELLVEISIGLEEAVDLWLLDHLDTLAEDPVDKVVDMMLDFWKRLLRPV